MIKKHGRSNNNEGFNREKKIHAVVLFFSEFDKRILLYEAKEMGIRAN